MKPQITASDVTPYDLGFDARLSGLPETANPYDPEIGDGVDFMSWNDGWHAADDTGDDE